MSKLFNLQKIEKDLSYIVTFQGLMIIFHTIENMDVHVCFCGVGMYESFPRSYKSGGTDFDD